jgi:H2-forming N5,N10-methylenetetrahydromethanopterin dehydrogenase-like enzyme
MFYNTCLRLLVLGKDNIGIGLTVDNFGFPVSGSGLALVSSSGHEVLLADPAFDLTEEELSTSVFHGHTKLPEVNFIETL